MLFCASIELLPLFTREWRVRRMRLARHAACNGSSCLQWRRPRDASGRNSRVPPEELHLQALPLDGTSLISAADLVQCGSARVKPADFCRKLDLKLTYALNNNGDMRQWGKHATWWQQQSALRDLVNKASGALQAQLELMGLRLHAYVRSAY